MKRRVPRARVGHDRWLVSYADFITLLFGFFVVLFAFSKADQRKQTQVVASIDAAFRSLGVSTETARAASNRHVGAGIDTPPTAQEMAENLVPPARVQADLDLTRRKLEQNLSGPNRVALVLQPPGQFALGHGRRQRGHQNLDRHA